MRKKILKRLGAVMLSLTLICTGALVPGQGSVVQAAGSVTVQSAQIAGANVVVKAATGAVPASDDGLFHLLAQETYEGGAGGREVAAAPASANASFSFALQKNTASSNLYKKFVVAVKQGGVLTPISNAKYITNPEAAAGHTVARSNPGKKGILPAATMLGTNDLKNLGVKQATYNVPIGNLLNGPGGRIPYSYNGKNYSFSAAIVGEYDSLVPRLNSQGIQVTLVILNNAAGGNTLIHPLSRGAGANYYAFNTADQRGVETLEAIASFLGQRYSNTGHGKVDNWIIGNEVNARAMWHYMANVDITTFTNEYQRAFRIFYNGIKAENGNARVYMCIDQQWSRPSNAGLYYGGQQFLTVFNQLMKQEGDLDWHVAMHPYNVPLTSITSWDNGAYATHSQGSPYISMNNIEVLTDFLGQQAFRAPNGQVRSVLLSEVGYTSALGEPQQAAAVTFAYQQAAANQHVDGIILSRELDDAGEIGQGLANGLVGLDGHHKMAYEFYRNLDTPKAATYVQQASAIIGADVNALVVRR